MKIGIIAKKNVFEDHQKSLRLSKVLALFLQSGAELFAQQEYDFLRDICPQATFVASQVFIDEIDFLIVFGGDGTVLRTAALLGERSIPVLAVNAGNVGFLSEIAFETIDIFIPQILNGAYFLEERMLLHVTVFEDDREVFSGVAFNEVVIHHGKFSRLIEVKISVDGEDLFNSKADGWIAASPTGSTAHSLSAGGPVLVYDLKGIILTPIAPANLSLRPFVIANHHQVTFTLMDKDYGDNPPYATIDGQTSLVLNNTSKIIVQKHKNPFVMVRFSPQPQYKTLFGKLQWR